MIYHSSRSRGYTLIEVMVAMILTGILASGVTSLFATVNEEFYALTLRQKAIFILNGEMERLYGIYQWGTPAATATPDSNYTGTTPPHQDRGAATHLTHSVNAPHNTLTTSDGGTTPVTLTEFQLLTSADFARYENAVLIYTAAGVTSNVVWLDYDKKLTARLSWIDDPITGTQCWENGAVGAGTSCHLITLYLDYPYRFDFAAGNPLADANMGTVQTLVLRTIMGDRY